MTEILKALRKARNEFPPVVKDQENPFFHSKYAALDAIIKAVTPALDANELTLLAGFDVIDGQSAIWMELHHDSGETLPKSMLLIPVKRTTKTDAETGEVTLTENNPQDVGSGISYMVRYSIKTYLGLPLEDDDGNRSSGRGKQQPSRPQGSTQQPPGTPSKDAGGDKGAKKKEWTLEMKVAHLEKLLVDKYGKKLDDLRNESVGTTELTGVGEPEIEKYLKDLRDLVKVEKLAKQIPDEM